MLMKILKKKTKLFTLFVNGFSHMNVFIAGATINGFFKSHALQTLVTKLSHIPFAIFANVFADNGAINNTFAHFLSYNYTLMYFV